MNWKSRYQSIRYELLIIFFLSNARSKISFHREKRFRFEPVPLHVDEWLIKAKQNGTEIVTKLFSFRETRYPRKDVGERINPSTPSELDVPFFFSVFPFLFFLFLFFFFLITLLEHEGEKEKGVFQEELIGTNQRRRNCEGKGGESVNPWNSK